MLLFCSGCLREGGSEQVLEIHYKWWTWLFSAFLLLYAYSFSSKHTATWRDGDWSPWWNPRNWYYLDVLHCLGAVVLALILPLQLLNHLTVDADGFRESNALGFRATKSVAWDDLGSIRLKADKPQGPWRPQAEKDRKKEADLVAELKDGTKVEFRGYLVRAARPEITRRAEANGAMPPGPGDPRHGFPQQRRRPRPGEFGRGL